MFICNNLQLFKRISIGSTNSSKFDLIFSFTKSLKLTSSVKSLVPFGIDGFIFISHTNMQILVCFKEIKFE